MDTEYMQKLRKRVSKLIKKTNVNLKKLQQEDLGQASKAYNYIANKWANRTSFIVNRNGYMQIRGNVSKMSRGELEHLQATLNRYSKASTATVKGTKQIYVKAWKTFNKNNDTNLTYNEWNSLMQNTDWQDGRNKYGSDTVLKVINKYGLSNALKTLAENEDIVSIKQFNERADEIANKNKG